jgi:hypothetical protein
MYFLSAATPPFRRGGMNQLKAGGSQEFAPRSATRGPVVLTPVCVQADSSRCLMCKVLRVVEGSFVGYKDLLAHSEAPLLGVGRGI